MSKSATVVWIKLKSICFSHKLKKIDDFVRVNKLPPFIKSRLRKYLHANSHMKKTKDKAVFDGVPVSLERDIMMYLYADIVKQAPILSNASSRLLENIVLSFETRVFLMGDFLMREGRMHQLFVGWADSDILQATLTVN